jgi:hypothetical protein
MRTNSIKQMTRLGFRCCSTVFTPGGFNFSGATSKPLVIPAHTRGRFTHQYASVESPKLLAQKKRRCVLSLVALGRRLDHTLAGVTRRGDTSEGIGFLVLEELVGLLLVLLGHCVRSRLSDKADHAEETDTGSDTNEDTPGDAGVGSRGVLSAGTVRAEGNPVSSFLLLEGQLGPVGLHAVTQSHPELGLLLEGHALPSLLDVGEGWVGDGVSRGSSRGQGGSAAHKALAQQVGGRCAQHGGRIYSNFGRQEVEEGGSSIGASGARSGSS